VTAPAPRSATGRARNVTRGTALADHLESGSTLWQKFMGLMGRAVMAPSSGLWLPGSNGIHMFFMRFAIDCVFLSKPAADGRRVVGVRRGLRPWVGIVWYVRGANGVLELPVGTVAATGTQAGDVVLIEDARPPDR